MVKLFGSLDRENDEFGRRANAVRDAGVRAAMLGRVFFVALGLVAALGTAAIYGIGAQLVVSGDITTGTLVALAALVTRVYQPLTGLTNARVDLMTSMVSFERVFEVLDAPEPIADKPGRSISTSSYPAGPVEFRDVTFRYPPADEVAIASMESQAIPGADPDRDVLSGLNLVIAPGETVALVGASGAGKSTLVSLIPRLYDVTSGAVLVDGARRPRPHAGRRCAVRSASSPKIRTCSTSRSVTTSATHARRHRRRVGRGLSSRPASTTRSSRCPTDTTRSSASAATGWSGGEKQRLAIARLLLKDPAIMILDEATSHLDNDNEAHVQASIEAALRGRTAIVIAHRLSTVAQPTASRCSTTGRIAEIGTHDELVAPRRALRRPAQSRRLCSDGSRADPLANRTSVLMRSPSAARSLVVLEQVRILAEILP